MLAGLEWDLTSPWRKTRITLPNHRRHRFRGWLPVSLRIHRANQSSSPRTIDHWSRSFGSVVDAYGRVVNSNATPSRHLPPERPLSTCAPLAIHRADAFYRIFADARPRTERSGHPPMAESSCSQSTSLAAAVPRHRVTLHDRFHSDPSLARGEKSPTGGVGTSYIAISGSRVC